MGVQQNFIAGTWIPAATAAPDINPSNTRDVVGEFARASRVEAEQAIGAAKAAFPAYSRSTPQERFDILDKAFDVRSTSRLGCQAKIQGADSELEVEISGESFQDRR